jgi:hypothetical protein
MNAADLIAEIQRKPRCRVPSGISTPLEFISSEEKRFARKIPTGL